MRGTEQIIRPAAVLPEQAAAKIVSALSAHDVSRGGVWNASVSVWQLYDRPWSGIAGTRGDAQLVGTIAVVYDSPVRHQITIYKAYVTDYGVSIGTNVDTLCDAALAFANLTLASCPRADMAAPPAPDPFHSSAAGTLSEKLASLTARNR